MPTRPRVLQFDVTVDQAGDARSALGGSPLPREAEWWAEHLALAGLVRCTLASLDYAARRAGVNVVSSGSAHGIVTKREEDGLYALVDIETTLEVQLAPTLEPDGLHGLLAKAEHGCFVSNSLIAKPRHRWIVNGQEVT
ncbi:MAG TPA: OsmC family protein [Gaiellaceae bacterium]|nr:OsmC family protein [Gaiellaceae bacterium]